MTYPAAHDDASGYIRKPEYRADDGFTEITEIHRSERNVVYRARRFGRFWVLKTVADAGSAALTAALRKEFEVAVMLRPIDRRPPDAECLLRMVDRRRSFRRAQLTDALNRRI